MNTSQKWRPRLRVDQITGLAAGLAVLVAGLALAASSTPATAKTASVAAVADTIVVPVGSPVVTKVPVVWSATPKVAPASACSDLTTAEMAALIGVPASAHLQLESSKVPDKDGDTTWYCHIYAPRHPLAFGLIALETGLNARAHFEGFRTAAHTQPLLYGPPGAVWTQESGETAGMYTGGAFVLIQFSARPFAAAWQRLELPTWQVWAELSTPLTRCEIDALAGLPAGTTLRPSLTVYAAGGDYIVQLVWGSGHHQAEVRLEAGPKAWAAYRLYVAHAVPLQGGPRGGAWVDYLLSQGLTALEFDRGVDVEVGSSLPTPAGAKLPVRQDRVLVAALVAVNRVLAG